MTVRAVEILTGTADDVTADRSARTAQMKPIVAFTKAKQIQLIFSANTASSIHSRMVRLETAST